ncbi:hypothetical protein CNE_BB1p04070 (plasmid) [Cupriavidus necator N-1]|uniref:Uncharacterized protein n=1 Tax=Cupriavidus necator (strain ATCC 43291 / DSM 13513 / CCUG 52238 / LMG 8453 / N-1) TaxID=1042878 RepID=F8GWW1_CUPNN|nr:hypothetical protein CNE_BB1p04070 [Cupriavidus necator N-1]
MLDFARLQALPDLLSHHAQVRPLATALEFEGRVTSYAELDERSTRLAALVHRDRPGSSAQSERQGAAPAVAGALLDRL